MGMHVWTELHGSGVRVRWIGGHARTMRTNTLSLGLLHNNNKGVQGNGLACSKGSIRHAFNLLHQGLALTLRKHVKLRCVLCADVSTNPPRKVN